jgi:predicted nucleic acid-binding protein
VGKLTPFITGRLVAFDTAPLIYYIEENLVYLPLVDELFDTIDSGASRGITSVLTLQEVLVKPLREGRQDISDQYRDVLKSSINITLASIDESVCEQAANLRAQYTWLRTPDALQIASAILHNAEVIVTNDDKWKRLTEIQIVVLQDLLTP